MNLYVVTIREKGFITEIETVRSESFLDAIRKVKGQLVVEGRHIERIKFSARKVDES